VGRGRGRSLLRVLRRTGRHYYCRGEESKRGRSAQRSPESRSNLSVIVAQPTPLPRPHSYPLPLSSSRSGDPDQPAGGDSNRADVVERGIEFCAQNFAARGTAEKERERGRETGDSVGSSRLLRRCNRDVATPRRDWPTARQREFNR
jgi:hypothetical protein